MSDDEPDYLSDDFLAQCVQNDVRPGLLHSTAQKRQHELLIKKQKEDEEHRKKTKSRAQIEQERRDEGLKTAIGQDNKGFQMLQKMGFKPGTSIGRQTGGSSGPVREPIAIEIKSDRRGLGEKSRLEEKRSKIVEWKKMREQLSDTTEFRSRKREDVLIREIKSDLRKAQSACKTLDLQRDKAEPKEPWLWPPVPKEKEETEDGESEMKTEQEVEEEEEEEEQMEPEEQLKILTVHLRKEYFYCIWCGTSYDDASDLRESCPGNSRQDH